MIHEMNADEMNKIQTERNTQKESTKSGTKTNYNGNVEWSSKCICHIGKPYYITCTLLYLKCIFDTC